MSSIFFERKQCSYLVPFKLIVTPLNSYSLILFLETKDHLFPNNNVNTTHKMESADVQSVDTDTTAGEDPLQDLSDEQLYQLVEETMCV